jgi:hypothetical protein
MDSTDTVDVTTVLCGLVAELCEQGGVCDEHWTESHRCAYYWLERGEITIFLGVTLEYGCEERLCCCVEVYDCSGVAGSGFDAATMGEAEMIKHARSRSRTTALVGSSLTGSYVR